MLHLSDAAGYTGLHQTGFLFTSCFKRKGENIYLWLFEKNCENFSKSRRSVKCPLILSTLTLGGPKETRQSCHQWEEGWRGVTRSTNLLLWVLHSSHGPRGPALDAHRVPLRARGAVGTSSVRAALLRLGMRIAAHPIQLRPLHHHGVHGAALWRNRWRRRLIMSVFITKAESLLCWHIH